MAAAHLNPIFLKCVAHMKFIAIFLIPIWLTHAPMAGASPTTSDFEICHKMAATTLEQCLNQHHNTDGVKCWDTAKRKNASCYQQINASYAPDFKKINAQKAAEEKMRLEKIPQGGK